MNAAAYPFREALHELIVTASDDGSVKVFQSASVKSFQHEPGPGQCYELVSHMPGADFSVPHSRAADFTARSGHSAPVLAAAYAAYDSRQRFLVTCSADCTAKVWMEVGDEDKEKEDGQDASGSTEMYRTHGSHKKYPWQLRHTFPEMHASHMEDPPEVGLLTPRGEVDPRQSQQAHMRQLSNSEKLAAAHEKGRGEEGSPEEHEQKSMRGHTGPINTACFWQGYSFGKQPDSGRIATGSDDGHVKIWKFPLQVDHVLLRTDRDNEQGKPHRPRNAELVKDLHTADKGHRGPVTVVSFNRKRDGSKLLLSASNDSTVMLWDAKKGTLHKRIVHDNEKKGPIWSAAYEQDDANILTCSADQLVKLWRITEEIKEAMRWDFDRDQSHRIQPVKAVWKDEFVPDMADSKDSRILVPCFDGSIYFLDSRSKDIGSPLRAHEACVWSAEYNFKGEYLLTASHDMTAAIWDVRKAPKPVLRIRGHRGMLWGATWSADGQRVLTYSEDGTAKVWWVSGGPNAPLSRPKKFAVLTSPTEGYVPAERMLTHTGGVTSAMFIPTRSKEDNFGDGDDLAFGRSAPTGRPNRR